MPPPLRITAQPASNIWPNLPEHNRVLLDGKAGRELADLNSDGSVGDEQNWRKAVKNALGSVDKVVNKLCNGCCDKVTIIIEIENDIDVMNGVNNANRELGTSYTKGENKKVYYCP